MTKEKPITFIKLGGAVITDKEVPRKAREERLASLVGQVSQAVKEQPDKQFVVGNGAGSFGHAPAKEYKTVEGLVSEESVMGMAIVQDAVAQLNRKVVAEFLKNEIPAVTFAPSNTLITAGRKERANFFSLLEMYLERQLLPVTYGDVIVDTEQGCAVWSTEQVLSFLIGMFLEEGYAIGSVVHVTDVPGFLDGKQEVVPHITQKNWPQVQKDLKVTNGFDVTGGMALKIKESLQLADKGVESVILSGVTEDNLYNYLAGNEWAGTTIA